MKKACHGQSGLQGDFLDGVKGVADLAVGTNFPTPARLGDRDGDGIFMDIESDIQ